MIIIAIDGPAGAGKGTISRFLSEKLNCFSIDSGLYYRYLGLQVFEDSSLVNNSEALENIARYIALKDLDDKRLRLEYVANCASQVAIHSSIRSIITKKIRDHVHALNDTVIIDGRDVGTVIFPDANLKLFITASQDVRVKRRETENNQKDLKQAVLNRDKRDLYRSNSPLIAAPDAIIIDTTHLTLDEMKEKTYQIIKNKINF